MKTYNNNKTRYRLCINETEVITTFPSDIDAFNFASVFVSKRSPFVNLSLERSPFVHLSLENLKTGNMIINVRKSD